MTSETAPGVALEMSSGAGSEIYLGMGKACFGSGKDVDSGMGSKIGIRLEVDMVLGWGIRGTKEMEKEENIENY